MRQPYRYLVGRGRVERRQRHERGEREADGVSVDHRVIAAEHAALLQPPDPLVNRGDGQARLLGKIGKASPAVLGQQPHDLPVEILHARTLIHGLRGSRALFENGSGRRPLARRPLAAHPRTWRTDPSDWRTYFTAVPIWVSARPW